ncbi:S-layer homology domain-containing protein [Oscillatoria sp. CS-180]|uniref:S-layer homology domain-containing protein n=1 Tax=Oscillatoria sp. CS-180 TaxID=3021720 RepID=UPI00232C5A4F|nr:S-layer homology domain-containing protein [Oscillatoria sp. CS-180]MDB9529444.1 S-layer homology domain-containing protein [Oscillatoria sp. CS-180]
MTNKREMYVIMSLLTFGLSVGCAGSPLGDQVQQSLEADPQLEDTSPLDSSSSEAGTEATDQADETSGIADNQTNSAQADSAEAETQTEGDAVEADNSAAADRTDEPADTVARTPEPGDQDFIGPVWSDSDAELTSSDQEAVDASNTAQALTGVPADLQAYIRDLQALELLALSEPANSTDNPASADQSPFAQPISRREYARWLFNSYNRFYEDEPGDRLRSGSSSDEPAFQDVPTSDPDFAVIQGLAEAGIIPSAFTGNSTAVNFRPDAPLVRESAILWKVPLDTRTALPTTTPEAVTAAWSFQDTASIDALALRAIAADFQLGDFSNFRRAFGYTTLFRPDKAVTRAEAAAMLWRFGNTTEGRNAAEIN